MTTDTAAMKLREIAGVNLPRLLRNLDETSYNEGSEALACRLTDCRAVILALLADRAAMAERLAEAGAQLDAQSAMLAVMRQRMRETEDATPAQHKGGESIEGDQFASLLDELICAHRFGGDRGKSHAALIAHITAWADARRPSAALSAQEPVQPEPDLARLKELALAAEPYVQGPWFVAHSPPSSLDPEKGYRAISCGQWGHFLEMPHEWADGDGAMEGSPESLAFVAACDPGTILDLIELYTRPLSPVAGEVTDEQIDEVIAATWSKSFSMKQHLHAVARAILKTAASGGA